MSGSEQERAFLVRQAVEGVMKPAGGFGTSRDQRSSVQTAGACLEIGR